MAEAISPTVTVEAFVEELTKDPMKDWYTMGFLLGLYEYPLKEITWKHRPNGINACLEEIYDTLEAEGVKLTWEQIIDALSTAAMDNKKLAKEINQKYCGGKYTTTHGTDEEFREILEIIQSQKITTIMKERDEELAQFLLKICRDNDSRGLTHDNDGFFLIKEIESKTKRYDLTPENVRRVVAITPELRLNRGPLPTSMKIRADTDHTDKRKRIRYTVRNEEKVYHYMSTICRFGDDDVLAAEDGSFTVKEIIDMKITRVLGTKTEQIYRSMYTEENVRKAIKYSNMDELILIENAGGLRIKHIAIHPEPLKDPEKWLWSDVRSCCCKAHFMNIPYDEDEGYVKVSDIVETLLEQHHNRDRDLREEDVIRVVKNCPPTCPQEWLILDETPPVRVKAKWGHIMPVKRPQIQPTLTTADKIPPFVIAMISRKIWVKQKLGIVPYARYRIELEYLDKAPVTDDEIHVLKHYGHHQVIVVIDLEKAIQDGLKFHLQPPRIIVCSEKQIPIQYIKRIL